MNHFSDILSSFSSSSSNHTRSRLHQMAQEILESVLPYWQQHLLNQDHHCTSALLLPLPDAWHVYQLGAFLVQWERLFLLQRPPSSLKHPPPSPPPSPPAAAHQKTHKQPPFYQSVHQQLRHAVHQYLSALPALNRSALFRDLHQGLRESMMMMMMMKKKNSIHHHGEDYAVSESTITATATKTDNTVAAIENGNYAHDADDAWTAVVILAELYAIAAEAAPTALDWTDVELETFLQWSSEVLLSSSSSSSSANNHRNDSNDDDHHYRMAMVQNAIFFVLNRLFWTDQIMLRTTRNESSPPDDGGNEEVVALEKDQNHAPAYSSPQSPISPLVHLRILSALHMNEYVEVGVGCMFVQWLDQQPSSPPQSQHTNKTASTTLWVVKDNSSSSNSNWRKEYLQQQQQQLQQLLLQQKNSEEEKTMKDQFDPILLMDYLADLLQFDHQAGSIHNQTEHGICVFQEQQPQEQEQHHPSPMQIIPAAAPVAVHNDEDEDELSRRIHQVRQVLPHLGEGFVEAVLSYYHGNVEHSVAVLLHDEESEPLSQPQKQQQQEEEAAALLEGLPESLSLLDRSLPRRRRQRLRHNNVNNEESAMIRAKTKALVQAARAKEEAEADAVDRVLRMDDYSNSNVDLLYDDDYDDQYDEYNNTHNGDEYYDGGDNYEAILTYNRVMKNIEGESRFWEETKNTNHPQQQHAASTLYRGPDKLRGGRLPSSRGVMVMGSNHVTPSPPLREGKPSDDDKRESHGGTGGTAPAGNSNSFTSKSQRNKKKTSTLANRRDKQKQAAVKRSG